MFLYMGTDFKDIVWHVGKKVQKCDSFSYEIFFDLCWDLLGFVPPPSPASKSKFPSRGNKYEKQCFFNVFLMFMKKLNNVLKL